MRKSVVGAAFALLMSAAGPGVASHGGDPGIDQRQHRLERRIEQGWRSGELTRREYRRLQHEARDIERMEHFFRSDGWLSPRDRHELHARLDHLAREIYREKHDSEHRSGGQHYQPHHYGQPHYGHPQYGQPQYGQPQYGQPHYGPYNRDYHADRRF